MSILFLYATQLPSFAHAYATGHSNSLPTGTLTKRERSLLTSLRRTVIRYELLHCPRDAYARPDFWPLMHEEIRQYAKRELRPVLFCEWDTYLREAPHFRAHFNHVDADLHRAWQTAVEENRSFIKHKYLSITSKRRAFEQAIMKPLLLGELELVCLGTRRYGIT